ncbi:MAG: helix-turn-helix domain-containing protein, partial [Chloroflexi bacterium]|nr:helix-turn-helix domain-containing protein [Chloroflexota bacterium]
LDNAGMKKQHVQLTETERDYLEELSNGKTVAVRVLKRALALLALDQGETLEAVARHQQLTNDTVAHLRNRYKQQGLGCLHDAPRAGRPVVIDGTQRAQITALACSDAPPGYRQWSLRLLADRIVELGYCEAISYTQVRQILKKTLSNHT